MARQLTLVQRCKIAAWQEVFQSLTAIQHEFEEFYGRHSGPKRSTVYVTHDECLEKRSVFDKPRGGRPATATTNKNTEVPEQTFVYE